MNPKQSLFTPKVLLFGVGSIIVLIIAGVMLMASGDGDTKALFSRAVAREASLYEMSKDAQDKLVHPDLRKLNADAQLFFSSNIKTLAKGSGAYGVKPPTKEQIKLVTDSDSAKRLDQAHQENRFDDTYASVLEQQVDAQQALLQELKGKARSRVQPYIEEAYQNLQSIQESLKDIRL
jgi:hypothetical protein